VSSAPPKNCAAIRVSDVDSPVTGSSTEARSMWAPAPTYGRTQVLSDT
jgi:hypothetical protein